jgi:peptide/nickel transport system ATP-binding protein
MAALPQGCPFAPRCPLAIDDCRSAEPELTPVGADHAAACIRVDAVRGRSAADVYGVSTTPPDRAADPDAPVVLRVENLVKTYQLTKGVVFRRRIGEVRAVDDIAPDPGTHTAAGWFDRGAGPGRRRP